MLRRTIVYFLKHEGLISYEEASHLVPSYMYDK